MECLGLIKSVESFLGIDMFANAHDETLKPISPGFPRESPFLERERFLPFSPYFLTYKDGLLWNRFDRGVPWLVYRANGSISLIKYQIFHYAKFDVFTSMMSTGEFWASDFRSMNDSSEISYCLDKIIIMAQSLLNGKKSDAGKINAFRDAALHNIELYFVSFSLNGNLLSQWRAYALPRGVSIGFVQSLFPTFGQSFSPYRLIKVIYDRTEQKELLRPIAADLSPLICQEHTHSDFEDAIKPLIDRFRSIAPRIKHPRFAEEQEVRLVSDGNHYQKFERINPNTGKITRYIKISFEQAFEENVGLDLPIWDIYAGPHENVEQYLREIYQVMCDNRRKFAVISDCEIPLVIHPS